MVTVDEVQRVVLEGGEVVGPDGHTIGHVGQLFLDATSGRPAWVTVATGLFGRGESFVPLTGAAVRGRQIAVPYDKDRVKHAPRIDTADGTLTPAEEAELYRYYGMAADDDAHVADEVVVADDVVVDDVATDDVATAPVATESVASPPAATAREHDAGGGAIARAEQVRVIGTERVPTERVRLRRYTVTEERTITVPVEREEYRVEYEAADGAGPLPPGETTDDSHHP